MTKESKSYLVCQNPECSLAQKKLAWITDFGIGTVTDSVKCYGCKKLFRVRSTSQESRKSSRSNHTGTTETIEEIPKRKKGGGKGGNNNNGKGGGKGNNSPVDPTTDVQYWKNMFEQAVNTAKDKGGIDVESLEALRAPPPPPVIVPGVTELNKLKKQIGHIERLREAKHVRLVENIEEFKQIRSDLAEFDSNIADLNEQFQQMVLDSKIVPVSHMDAMDTSDHVSVPNDVSLWDADMVQIFQTKLLEHQHYLNRVQTNMLEGAIDADIGLAIGTPPIAPSTSFGKASKGSGRSTPYEKFKPEADIDIDADEEEGNEEFPEDMLAQHLEEATLLAGSSAAASSGATPQCG